MSGAAYRAIQMQTEAARAKTKETLRKQWETEFNPSQTLEYVYEDSSEFSLRDAIKGELEDWFDGKSKRISQYHPKDIESLIEFGMEAVREFLESEFSIPADGESPESWVDWNEVARVFHPKLVEELGGEINSLDIKDITTKESGAKGAFEDRKEVAKMADNNEKTGVFINVPSKISATLESVRPWDYTDDNDVKHDMVEVTVAPGTEIDGQDASYYKFSCTQGQLDPAGQKYADQHSILLPEVNSKTGEPWTVKLTRDFGQKDGNGEWVPDVKEINCTTTELRDACKEQRANYIEHRKAAREAAKAEKSAEEAPSLSSEAKDAREASAEMADQGDAPQVAPPAK